MMPTAISLPDFTYEQAAQGHVAGVDEAGRAPLAGPVVAAAVILNPDAIPKGLNDSKKLSKKKREQLYDIIQQQAIAWSIAQASREEIDQINILHASMLAMQRAVSQLSIAPTHALIDGNRLPEALPCPATAVVKGDQKSLSIAAASILAKVWRDRHMAQLAQAHPHYGWERNAGYPVKEHVEGIRTHGVTPHHRRSFAIVRDRIAQGELAYA
jgi:ribonuclease HII